MTNILVYGATGAQGRPVARQLIAAGHDVRILLRKGEGAPDLIALGAEPVIGDMMDPDSLERASAGVAGVFLLVPFLDPRPEYGINAIDAAARAGVRRIVWNASGAIMPVDTGNPGIDMRRVIVAHLEASGVNFAALQPAVYMENLLGPWTAPEVAAKDSLAYPIPNSVRLQWISHEDAAAFVVAAFDQLTAGGHRIEICGPETLTGEDIADRFGKALGRTITFRPMPPKEFGAIMDSAFGGGGDSTAAFYEAVYANPGILSSRIDYAALSETLNITPVPMEDFARRHAAVFGDAST
ncbi:SDR family oxidoreductase [Jannaschia formosa]|uniref:SDR family oxidoreductase n=1 Tax=Jannaschia formosa TaxID=2259592 RepID=UPI000E1C0F0A|nr:NmrA family NAD(P)-binding protein [Jannaschia formosa]TFL16571.1 NAD-dependent epimerase/dehydratase family protein [Jannaschia formosa]